ncbi:hypothetical protein NLG97_g2915 [Lecanicillium saksenae]|uniref:Uncharacterized protein n=1 Tax=Lecanicillium saksenae TaxID=468837 RepID=A0ACC1R0U0_9HYPO|nr:hypothetical protein NLG97_g2915 [Lecanicillium saksenae]
MRYTLTHNGQLSSLGKRIMAEPTSTRGKTHIDEQFWVFLESLCIHHSSHLNSIHGDELDLKRWNSIAASHTCHRQLPELHELSLEFRKVRHEKDETPQLAEMIAQAGSLRKLRLSFDVLTAGKPGFDVHLPDVIGQGLHLRFLGNLSLMGVRTTEAFLRELMQKLSGTLSSLELEEISFETADSEWADPEMVELECNWSWIHFLSFLADNMSLKHAKFDGELSSGQEQWEVGHDGTEGAQSSNHDCLKCRIERYVTHQGPNPFPANMKYFEQDYSWHSYSYDDSIYD